MTAELMRIRLITGLPALEVHRETSCFLYAFAGGIWHSWDLPCDSHGHQLAVDEDVRTQITMLEITDICKEKT